MGALVFFGFFLGYSENATRDFDKRGWGGGAEQHILRCARVPMRKGMLLLVGETENSIPPPLF